MADKRDYYEVLGVAKRLRKRILSSAIQKRESSTTSSAMLHLKTEEAEPAASAVSTSTARI